jgi:predicted ATPase
LFIEHLRVDRFRHLRTLEFGPFRAPSKIGELIVLAGQNGGGKSSILELLALGLATRYSYQYYQARQMADYSFAIKIGLTDAELTEIETDATADPAVAGFARQNRGYWTQVNLPEALGGRDPNLNERVHGLVSKKFQSFARQLGFFIRSDRAYAARTYDQRTIFNYRNREEPRHLSSISYKATTEQYADMYDFLVEQSYHHIYELGTHYKRQQQGQASTEPSDPLASYKALLSKLFPGYSFVDVSRTTLALQVQLPSGDVIPFQDMSSGEKEVFFILAFFIRHNISNSVIVVDEPELHLHPELGRKFVRLMRTIMPGNQIWIATHSAELIDEAGRERAFFVRRKLTNPAEAEAVPATSEEDELQMLRDLFGYSGYIGVSKKLVFMEGTSAGADRKTFTNLFPEYADEIKIIPSGSSSNLQRINRAILALLSSNVARCEFYLIRDRDYMSEQAVAKQVASAPNRLFVLQRHEIENYLLDEEVIQVVLADIYQKTWSKQQVRDELLTIAKANSATYLRDMTVARYAELFQGEDCSIGNHSSGFSIVDSARNLDLAVTGPLKNTLQAKISTINQDISSRMAQSNIDQIFEECAVQIREALDPSKDIWKTVLPGKELLQQFAKRQGLGEWPALQNLIIERMSDTHKDARGDLVAIFERISGKPVANTGA